MASSSHSENLIGEGIVHLIPDLNLRAQNDEALYPQMEQSPVVVITLEKKPDNIDHVSDEHKPSFKLPTGWFTELFTMVEAQDTQAASGKILRSKLINFRLPEDCVDCILQLDEEVKATHSGDCLSLLERLEGWIIEKIRRDNTGKYDKYFYHIKSGGRFRSFIEVETFVIHCTFPKRRTRTKDINIISEKKRQEVEKFLEEAWRNFSNDQHHTRRRTKDINIISKRKRQEFEKMLEEEWRNLSSNQQQHTSVEDVLTPERRVGEHS